MKFFKYSITFLSGSKPLNVITVNVIRLIWFAKTRKTFFCPSMSTNCVIIWVMWSVSFGLKVITLSLVSLVAQIIRNTLWERGGSQIVTKYHQGGGGGDQSVMWSIFCDFLTLNLTVLNGCERPKSNFREYLML